MIKEDGIKLVKIQLEEIIKMKYIKTNNKGRPTVLDVRTVLDAIFLCSN